MTKRQQKKATTPKQTKELTSAMLDPHDGKDLVLLSIIVTDELKAAVEAQRFIPGRVMHLVHRPITQSLGEAMGDGAPARLLQKIEGILGRCVFDQPDSLDYDEGVVEVRKLLSGIPAQKKPFCNAIIPPYWNSELECTSETCHGPIPCPLHPGKWKCKNPNHGDSQEGPCHEVWVHDKITQSVEEIVMKVPEKLPEEAIVEYTCSGCSDSMFLRIPIETDGSLLLPLQVERHQRENGEKAGGGWSHCGDWSPKAVWSYVRKIHPGEEKHVDGEGREVAKFFRGELM